MKKLLFLLVIIFSLTSCDGVDPYKMKMAAMDAFPDAQFIYSPPGTSCEFIVLSKDSTLYHLQNVGIFTAHNFRIDKIYDFKKK